MSAYPKETGRWTKVRSWAVGIGVWWFVLGLIYMVVTGQLGRPN